MTIFPGVDRASLRALYWFSSYKPTCDCVDHRGSKSPDIHVRPTNIGLRVLTMCCGWGTGHGEWREIQAIVIEIGLMLVMSIGATVSFGESF
jgi:hypothetical protein